MGSIRDGEMEGLLPAINKSERCGFLMVDRFGRALALVDAGSLVQGVKAVLAG